MAKKTKKRAAKRKPARTKSKTSRKPKKAGSRRKVKAKSKAKRSAPRRAASPRTEERSRLLREERALERDVENEPQATALSESPEYIPGASEDGLAEELGEAAVE